MRPFIGGEPTLYRQLRELIETAQRLGFTFVEIFTNGTLLDGEWIRFVAERGVHLAFSVYSWNSSVHDGITLRRGSWAQTISSIRLAQDAGVPVRVGIIEMDANAGQTEATKEFLRSIGVSDVGEDRLRGVGRGLVSLTPIDPMDELCGACSNGRLVIDSAGNVYPCVFSRFRHLGTVNNGLRPILDDSGLAEFRNTVRANSDARGGSARADSCKPDKRCGPSKCYPEQHQFCRPW